MSPTSRERTPKDRLLQLMAYADGELDPHELAELEAELARDPEGQEVVAAFRGVGARVRGDLVQVPDLTDAIMQHLQSAETSHDRPIPRSDPAELAHAHAAHHAGHARHAIAHGAQVLDLAAARARRFKIGVAVASIAAAAAAVALWIGRPLADGGLSPELATAAMGVQVQHVDSQEKVTVFSIPALHSNASSVVVWLGDDQGEAAAAKDAAAPSTP